MKGDFNFTLNGKKYEYPPGPSEIFPYRLALKFISNPLPILKEITNSYGVISHFKFGPKLHVYLVNDPYQIENILVKHNQYFAKSPGLQLAKRVIGNGLITNEGESHKTRKINTGSIYQRQNKDLWKNNNRAWYWIYKFKLERCNDSKYS